MASVIEVPLQIIRFLPYCKYNYPLYLTENHFIIPRQHGWVVYIDGNGNTDISSATDLIIVDRGIVKVFPNPTNGRIFLEFEEEIKEDYYYNIYSIEGKNIQNGILSKGANESTIDLETKQSGTYIIKLRNSDRLITKLIQFN